MRSLFVGLADSPQGPPSLLVQGAVCQHASLGIAPLQVALKGGSAARQALKAQPRPHVLQKSLPICINQHAKVHALGSTASLLFATVQVVHVSSACLAAR